MFRFLFGSPTETPKPETINPATPEPLDDDIVDLAENDPTVKLIELGKKHPELAAELKKTQQAFDDYKKSAHKQKKELKHKLSASEAAKEEFEQENILLKTKLVEKSELVTKETNRSAELKRKMDKLTLELNNERKAPIKELNNRKPPLTMFPIESPANPPAEKPQSHRRVGGIR